MGSGQSSDSVPEVVRLQNALAAIGGGVADLQEVLGPVTERWERAETELAARHQEAQHRLEVQQSVAEQREERCEDREARVEAMLADVEAADTRWRELHERQSTLEERIATVEDRMRCVEEKLIEVLSADDVKPVTIQNSSDDEDNLRPVDSASRMNLIEDRVSSLETSLQRALDIMFPRVDALLMQLEVPQRVDCPSPSRSPIPPVQAAGMNCSPSTSDANRMLDPCLVGPPGPDFPPPPPYEELDSLMSSSRPALSMAPWTSSPVSTAATTSTASTATTAATASTNGVSRVSPTRRAPSPPAAIAMPPQCILTAAAASYSEIGNAAFGNTRTLSGSLLVSELNGIHNVTPRDNDSSSSVQIGIPSNSAQIGIPSNSAQIGIPSNSAQIGTPSTSAQFRTPNGVSPYTRVAAPRNTVLDAALLTAAREGSASEVRALLDRDADPNACDSHGRSALHWAATYGRHASITLLLNGGANPNARSSRSLRGFTPLHEAALRGHAECVRLLAGAGADLESGDDAGWTPLHLAAIRGQEAAARTLLQAGAQTSARNIWGKRPRDVARMPALRRLLAR